MFAINKEKRVCNLRLCAKPTSVEGRVWAPETNLDGKFEFDPGLFASNMVTSYEP